MRRADGDESLIAGEQGLGIRANESESLINVVKSNEPPGDTSGSNQNGTELDIALSIRDTRTQELPANRRGPNS